MHFSTTCRTTVTSDQAVGLRTPTESSATSTSLKTALTATNIRTSLRQQSLRLQVRALSRFKRGFALNLPSNCDALTGAQAQVDSGSHIRVHRSQLAGWINGVYLDKERP